MDNSLLGNLLKFQIIKYFRQQTMAATVGEILHVYINWLNVISRDYMSMLARVTEKDPSVTFPQVERGPARHQCCKMAQCLQRNHKGTFSFPC